MGRVEEPCPRGGIFMMEKIKKPVFWLGILGALKLLTDTAGYTFISNEQVDQIANGLSALVTVVAVAVDHGATTSTVKTV